MDVKSRAVRGGLAKAVSQGITLVLRIGAVAVLARMLGPAEFGVVNMVTAIIGILHIIKDAGLSLPTIQRAKISQQQLSALFWINALVGAALTLLTAALAPALAAFYREPRLVAVTIALAPVFLIYGLGVQHAAIVSRNMRFLAAAVIDVAAIVLSTGVGIGMALAGKGYWSLVGMSLAWQAVASGGAWIAAGWVPDRPSRGEDIRSLLQTGGTVTLNVVVVYFAYNFEKVLLGRFWGADAIGIYGRAYQLINAPTENFNTAVSGVAISALSRMQDDPSRQKSYFLKGYSLVLSLITPVAIAFLVFAEDIVRVVLGPKWGEAAPILRLLSPTILTFALLNPLSWWLYSHDLTGRSLRIGLVIAPLVIGAYLFGLPYGPRGVALAYSSALAVGLVPLMAWSIHGTAISARDLVSAIGKPFISGAVAAALCLALRMSGGGSSSAALRLLTGCALLSASYLVVLLYGTGQKAVYLDLLRSLRRAAPSGEPG